jgi:ABC-2 type transport system permease protein
MFISKLEGALRKYCWIGLLSAKSNLAYWPEVVSRLLFLVVILYVFLRLWQSTYAQLGTSELGGMTIAQMLWYLTITEAIAMSGPRVSQLVDEDVRTGAIAVQLLKPFSYPLYRLSTNIGERGVRFAINLLCGAIVALSFVGALPIDWFILPLSALTILLAFTIDFLAQFCIGLGAFWLEDTSGLLLIYSRLTMILGGLLMPIELFPEILQKVAHALPFWTVYGVAKVLVNGQVLPALYLVAAQLLTICSLLLVATLIYSFAMRRVASHGG